MFSKVDFPLPEGPSTTTNSPAERSRSTPRSACTSTSPMRYTLVTPCMWKTGSGAGAAGFGVRSPAGLGGSMVKFFGFLLLTTWGEQFNGHGDRGTKTWRMLWIAPEDWGE